MPKAYKTAGQAIPAANVDTVLYTVPADTNFVESTLSICNQDTAGVIASYRVAVVPAGETLASKHYLVYEQLIDFRSSKFLTLGLSLAQGDKIYVRSSTATVSFGVFGVELS